MKNQIRLAVFAIGCCLFAVAPPVAASTITYDVALQAGNQTWQGALGMDFNVLSPIVVDQLGMFDSNGDGFAYIGSAAIYNRATQTVVASLVFGTGPTGNLVGGSRFLTLLTPLTLPAGFQGSIIASGYGLSEPNGNLGCNLVPGSGDCLRDAIVGSTMNTGGGLIEFVGGGRYSTAVGVFPTTIDGGPANRYLAGTFRFDPVPEPGTLLLVGTGALALVRRRFSRR